MENNHGIEEEVTIPRISDFVETVQSKAKAYQHMLKTRIGHNEQLSQEVMDFIQQQQSNIENSESSTIPLYEQCHQANVCVCCDRFICGTEELCWIKKSTLLQHKSRLTMPNLNSHLQACYTVLDPELHELLLSPRARVKTNGDYLCCSQCFRSLKNDYLGKNPPKFAIANNFAIGTLPSSLADNLTEVSSPLLSPVRPYAFVLSYSGGAHKAISGSFSFFSQSVEKNIGALNFHTTSTKESNVYVIMSGNFTPTQRQIVKSRCMVHVAQFKEVFDFLSIILLN